MQNRRLHALFALLATVLVVAWLVPAGNDASEPAQNSFAGIKSRAPPASDAAFAAVVVPLMADSSPDSSHPVERATARGTVLEQRITPGPNPLSWTRTLLLRTEARPRPVRVVEHWIRAPDGPGAPCHSRGMFLADQLIVTTPPGVSETTLRASLASSGLRLVGSLAEHVWTVRLPAADLDPAPAALALLATQPGLVKAAEADGVGFGSGLPNDTSFSQQWGLHNTGQFGGAPEFWTLVENAPGIVIAVLDSGLNFTHPDLQGLAWSNPGEIAGDGLDNDFNGKVDDVTGWDFVKSDNHPADDHGHGSNVTGINAANRGDSQGVAGLVGGVRILVCKVLNFGNSGLTSDLISATI